MIKWTEVALSPQVTVLRAELLVATRREGKNIRLASPQALAIMQVLDARFCAPAKPSRSRP